VLVQRFDTAKIPTRRDSLGSGGLRFTAELTRSGVFEYTRADGSKVREYRPPDEVAKADALASLEDLPVTIGHPPFGVSPESYQKVAVGHMRGAAARSDARGNGNVTIGGSVIVHRRDAVDGVSKGKLVETSMGYGCRIDATPGVTPDGEPFDVVQRDMVYNHGALLRRGEARLGTRVDSGEAITADYELRLDANGNQLAPANESGTLDVLPEKPIMKVTIKIDGKDKEVESGSPEHVSYLEAKADAAAARADAVDAELATFRADAAKAARAKLEATASDVLGKKDAKFDGKSDREVKAAVIAKRLPTIKLDGKDDAYVDHMFDAALAVVAAPKKSGTPSRELAAAFSAKTDAADPKDKASDDDGDEDEPAFMKKAKKDAKDFVASWESSK
jgi:hypothetical protein